MGSLLLTPQENESLFTFLGKKCVVSGRDPRRHGPGLEGREVGVGKKEAGAARGRSGRWPGLPPAPHRPLAPLLRCRQCEPRRPDSAAWS